MHIVRQSFNVMDTVLSRKLCFQWLYEVYQTIFGSQMDRDLIYIVAMYMLFITYILWEVRKSRCLFIWGASKKTFLSGFLCLVD